MAVEGTAAYSQSSGTASKSSETVTASNSGESAVKVTGGTITVTGGVVNTSGTKSPEIYSTGKITATGTSITAAPSEAVTIEGKNSVTANNCTFKTSKTCGVFIYQSTSGDAAVGSGTFTMTGGALTAEDGPLFYSTNTDALINLKGAALNASSGILLKACADQWGTTGSNGSNVTLAADSQSLSGNVFLDKISTATLTLKNSSSLSGAINSDKTAKSATLSLDKTRKWTVTGTSYLTSLTDADTALSNINENGNNIYYDSSSSANSWLKGKTATLKDGGKLIPY